MQNTTSPEIIPRPHWVHELLSVMEHAATEFQGRRLEFDCNAKSAVGKVFVNLSVDGGDFELYAVIGM